MYFYNWDKKTHGYKLTTQTGRFVANEIRPVFAPELLLTGLSKRFEYDKKETRPLLWAQKNVYLSDGEKVAQLNNTQYGKPLSPEFFFTGKMKLEPTDIEAMVNANAPTMDIIVADAKRRTKELYDADIKRCDIAYIAFSGGKDSVALLDVCNKVLPLSVPVIFSDTDMELPDTYKVWEEIQARYPEREFICAKAESSALENWRRFAPPSRTIRWCCSVHKSTPALMLLKDKLHKSSIKAMAFVGVRGEESHSRSFYEDSTDGVKNASQLNRMPILDWGSHELWLYIFANDLLVNCAYKKGLTRVGCLMCPESPDKHLWFVDKAYLRLLKPYKDIIIETSNKNFRNAAEKNEYVGGLSWQARGSGAVLRETISRPLEQIRGLTVSFQSPYFTRDLFYEWIKTFGTVIKVRGTNQQKLKLPKTLDEGIPFSYDAPYTGGGTAIFEFNDEIEKSKTLPLIRSFLHKVSACIACRACEAECSRGALSVKNGKLKVDGARCTKCRKCYEVSVENCWRYNSMRYEVSSSNKKIGFSTYFTFGLREEWIASLVDMGETFFPWNENHPLGKKMVPSASAWFSQSALVQAKTHKLLPLVDIFINQGVDSVIGWNFIWLELSNNAAIIKWFIMDTKIDTDYTLEQLSEKLLEYYPMLSKTSKEDGVAALRDTLIKSPLGKEEGVAVVEMKGKQVKSIMRKSKDVSPLTILYGLYLIATKADRENFTVRELMTVGDESDYISPITAFGISPDMFKKQCEGLKSKYPDYIETTFTHGNDELTVFPNKYTTEDVIKLALGE